jgi:TolB-like protein
MKDQNDISVDVVPFENLGSAGTGLDKMFVVDLITALSRFRQFNILQGDGGQADSSDATYTIKGAFRKDSNLLKINTQLINNARKQIVWAEWFEDKLNEIGSVDERAISEIVSSLNYQLNQDLLTQLTKKPTQEYSAYELWLTGMSELKDGTLEADERARKYFQQALGVNPGYALAFSGMSLTYFNEWSCQLWEKWDLSQRGAYVWAKKAIDKDQSNYVAAMVLGRVYLYEAKYDIAEHYLRKALRLNPNDADILIQIASCFVFLGHVSEAEQLYNSILKWNPQLEEQFYYVGAFIAFEQGHYSECINLSHRGPLPWVDSHSILAAAHFESGDKVNMEKSWANFMSEFKRKVLNDARDAETSEAIRWIINISPYKCGTHYKRFWEYMSGTQVASSQRVFMQATPAFPDNVFFKEKGGWHISYEGESFHLPDAKGLNDLARLLGELNEEIHCADLMGSMVKSSSTWTIDEQARNAYQRRLVELQKAMSEEEDDSPRSSKLNEEYDSIVSVLTSAVDIRGRIRKSADPGDKIRSAVTLRIRSSIKKIASVHPALGIHLSNSIKTGFFCSYKPEKKVIWIT